MKISFYANVERSALDLVEFYKVDLDILKEIDPKITIATRWRDIDWSADVIFIWWWTYAFIPILLNKIYRKKIVITGTFNYKAPYMAFDYFRRRFYQQMLIKYSLINADKNILVSQNEYDLIKNDLKLNNLEYSPHCIDTDIYSPAGKRDKNTVFTICWTGKENLQRKSLPEIVKSAVFVKKEGLDYKFIIAGRKGDGFDYIKNMIEEYRVSDIVELKGEITLAEKLKFLRECAVYLQPSKYEGFGVAIAEAMSCGATVISTKYGEVPNVVGDCGILIDSSKEEEIFRALKQLKTNGIKIDYGAKARNRIIRRFAYQKRSIDFREVLYKLLKTEDNKPLPQ